MSNDEDQPKSSDNTASQEMNKANQAGSNGMHQCPSWTSFRTATPDSTFGHELQRVARPMTRDPAAEMRKCASTASIRTLAPETEFGHQLHRCAKRTEQVKENGKRLEEEKGSGSNGERSTEAPRSQ